MLTSSLRPQKIVSASLFGFLALYFISACGLEKEKVPERIEESEVEEGEEGEEGQGQSFDLANPAPGCRSKGSVNLGALLEKDPLAGPVLKKSSPRIIFRLDKAQRIVRVDYYPMAVAICVNPNDISRISICSPNANRTSFDGLIKVSKGRISIKKATSKTPLPKEFPLWKHCLNREIPSNPGGGLGSFVLSGTNTSTSTSASMFPIDWH